MMAKRTVANARSGETEDTPVRTRILDAAFAAFMERGFAETSTLEIATRARASKRELYAHFASKQDMLMACIDERARRMQMPADLPEPHDRETLARTLAAFGTRLLHETSDLAVIAVFRLAIAEATRAPEVAQVLNTVAIESSRARLRNIMSQACSAGLLQGNPGEMAELFAGLLWGSQTIRLLLRVAERPDANDIARRAEAATHALLQLHGVKGAPQAVL